MQGLYKFRFTTARGTGSGVMFATSGGRLYGGDSGSSFVGHFTETDGIVSCEVTMSRHYHDPKYVPMFEVEHAVMNFRARPAARSFILTAAARPCPASISRRF
ncbi:GrlR family regulatory protein [Bradyrhizobium sp. sGM-13]|uniref:GrlR family regulatory protein n=1 Tax=Bradyrhizobium sp. sGM-13 TaxID=2831781 RepID=UPI001BCB7730|nr:GrlR family regulatory protein [Bradyrhizobium sp. sGM-13]